MKTAGMIITEETGIEMREMTTKDETETDQIPTEIARRNTITTPEKVETETREMTITVETEKDPIPA